MLNYKLSDLKNSGLVLASGDQLAFEISVDLEAGKMRVRSGAIVTTYDIGNGDAFTLAFHRPGGAQ